MHNISVIIVDCFVGCVFSAGLGLMLLVVIIVGWRCTPAGHEPCHLLFNFEQWFDVSRSQRVGQTVRRRDRALDQNQWFGGTFYSAFFRDSGI